MDFSCDKRTRCAKCGEYLSRVGLTNILTTWETCYCDNESFPHVIEQKWHRSCFVLWTAANFVVAVNEQAEINMEKTGVLEGAHYAAIQSVLAKLEAPSDK